MILVQRFCASRFERDPTLFRKSFENCGVDGTWMVLIRGHRCELLYVFGVSFASLYPFHFYFFWENEDAGLGMCK